jgi:YesN/AraC family two-component response regulator
LGLLEERTPAYKVMIAEDELLVRVGLNLTVPWEDYGMQVVAVVEDGVSAWEAYQIHRPNIVLTDLCMPGMDGVELVRKIRESGEVCEIIIITCIEDFDTLYQLMKMGITGYLVKATMVQKDIDEVLKKALNNLKDIYVSVAYTTSLPGDMRKANPLYDFVFVHHDSDLYLSECEKHEQYYKHIQYCILILWDSQVRSILKSSITSIFQKRLNPFRVSDVYFDDELLFISLAHTDEHDINEIYLVIRELLSYIDEVLDVKLRIVICETKGSDERLAKLVSKGQIILRNSYFYPSSLTVLQADRPGESGTFDLHDCITLL